MGGDHAPGPIVAGALQAVAADPEVTVVLVGDKARIESLLPADGPRDRVEIFHAADTIGMHDSPVDALSRLDPDLLVVGSRGLQGFRALGSVSERVAHEARCSVLVVR
jgi:fatty acid/phospholipid biosynthesis enzyme